MKRKAYEHYFIPALNDYLGLLEVAYMMLEKNQDFLASYKYRVLNILDLNYVKDRVLSLSHKEYPYWKNLKN